MRQRLRDRLEISPRRYAQVTAVALAALALIVLTGAAVRLTGSGLGCPDWPKCYGGTMPPLETHAVIEYGNRLLTGFVGFAVIAASVLAFFRRPYRWHLALFGALLPLGVIGQAILGALVVKYHLAPGLVMSHFILSMMLLDAAFALAWCSRYEPWERRRSSDRLGVWSVRALIPLGQLTILAGTIATASGPHAGAHEGELVHRFEFQGGETLEWVVQRHAAIAAVYGVAAIAVWFLLRRPGGDRRALKPLTVVMGLLALQGAIGGIQWAWSCPGDRLGPRRPRHPQLAGDAVDGCRRRAARAPRGPAAPAEGRAARRRDAGRRLGRTRAACSRSGSRSASSASCRRRWSQHPKPASAPFLGRLRSSWWALVLPLPIAVVVAAIALDSAIADFLTYLALVAVPPLAALALAAIVRGARPPFALLVVPLFALAWATRDSLAGETAALVLSSLACVSLGWLLVCVVPARWVKVGIYAMAAIDAWLVGSQPPAGAQRGPQRRRPGGRPAQAQFVPSAPR